MPAIDAGSATPATPLPATGSTGQCALLVAVSGTDSGTGTVDAPFASIQRAISAARALSGPQKSICLRGGEYALTSSLQLTADDSGISSAPLTIRSYPGERAVISGGSRVSLTPAGSLWEGIVAGPRFSQLFVNGQRKTLARTPNAGFYYIESILQPPNFASQTIYTPTTAITYKPDPQLAVGDIKNARVVVLHRWAEDHLRIRSFNPQTRSLYFQQASGMRLDESSGKLSRFFIEGARDFLDAPGEWYWDDSTQKLSYIPQQGEASASEAVIPRLATLLAVAGTPARPLQHVTFENLAFSYSEWLQPDNVPDLGQAAFRLPAAVQVRYASDVTFQGCSFSHLGGYAVEFANGAQNNRFAGNSLDDLGGGGIRILGSHDLADSSGMASGNTIENNTISNVGRRFPTSVGILLMHGRGNTIAHNEISKLSYTGISVGWVWGFAPSVSTDNIIRLNHIHDISGPNVLSDLGGIYTLGPSPGTVIDNNYVHDISSYAFGGNGIYLDEGSSSIRVSNNVVSSTSDSGVFVHKGRDNDIENNVFALSGTSEITIISAGGSSATLSKNIVYAPGGRIATLSTLCPDGEFDFNDYFDADLPAPVINGNTWQSWRASCSQDQHSVTADPKFQPAGNNPYALAPDSPALRLGFQPIDLSAIGPVQ